MERTDRGTRKYKSETKYHPARYSNIEMPDVKQESRTDPNLYPDITKDMIILRKMASKMIASYRSYVFDEEDLFQKLCELYLEGRDEKYFLKPRKIPHRVFVFSYIKFVMRRLYRTQHVFEEREVATGEFYDLSETVSESKFNPNADTFFENPDIAKIVAKYSNLERLIMYYRFFLGIRVKDLKDYIYIPIPYHKVAALRKKLKVDRNIINLMKERNVRFGI